MNENSFWIDSWGISGYTDKTTVNQQNKEFQIEISKEADRIPRIEVYTTRKDKLSHKIPQSSKYNKITRIQESEFNEYFNQTLQNLHHLDVSGGEYFISSDDYSDTYELEAFNYRTLSEEKHREALDIVFGITDKNKTPIPIIKATELIERLMKAYKTVGYDRKKNCHYNLRQFLLNRKVIEQTELGFVYNRNFHLDEPDEK